MFLVELDKLDIRRTLTWFLFIIHDLKNFGIKRLKQMKSNAVLLQLADVAYAL